MWNLILLYKMQIVAKNKGIYIFIYNNEQFLYNNYTTCIQPNSVISSEGENCCESWSHNALGVMFMGFFTSNCDLF